MANEFHVLQACVRRHDETRFGWAMTALAVRLARALGLHRDGTAFGLSPYETEMRRRLWWNICVLDGRTAEDYGSDPVILDNSFDTRLPLNIEDDQISPDSTELPTPSTDRCTEMCFSLLRFEVAKTVYRLEYVALGPGTGGEDSSSASSSMSLQRKERILEEMHKRLEEKYLKYYDMKVPLQWVTATIGRLVMAKLWLTVYHPLQYQSLLSQLQQQRSDGEGPKASSGAMTASSSSPQSIRDRLFVTAIEVIEYFRLVATEQRVAKWTWMFRIFVPWHPLAYVISELCVRTKGEMTDRAWAAIDSFFENSPERVMTAHSHGDSKKGLLWGLLRQLMAKARRLRERDREETGIPENNERTSSGDLATTTSSGIDTTETISQAPSISSIADVLTANSSFAVLQQQLSTQAVSTVNNERQPASAIHNGISTNIFESIGGANDDFASAEFWKTWDDAVKNYQMDLDFTSTDLFNDSLGVIGSVHDSSAGTGVGLAGGDSGRTTTALQGDDEKGVTGGPASPPSSGFPSTADQGLFIDD